MSLTTIPLTIIVAATKSNGIGKNGALPWPMLKKEMAYFARVTKRVPMPQDTGSLQSDTLKQTILEGQRKNVVIMGRKTWESIPPKLRPLKDRTNIVISTQPRAKLEIHSDDVIVADSIQSGLQALERQVEQGQAKPVGRAFIIGGTTIYKAALELSQTSSILLTRIGKEYDCDTIFPVELGQSDKIWQRKTQDDLSKFVGEEVGAGPMTESDVQYEFQLFEKA